MKLLKATDAGASLGKDGSSVTLFAPDNKAMAAMPNKMNSVFAETKMAAHRNLFAQQHIAPEVVEQISSAQSNYRKPVSPDDMVFASANPNKHIGFGRNADGVMQATLYDNSLNPVASADISKTITDHSTGVTLHVMSSALLD
jgi:hypothetical protein